MHKKNKMNHDLIQEILLIKEPYNLIGCNHSRLKYRDKNFPWSIAQGFQMKIKWTISIGIYNYFQQETSEKL